MNLHDFISLFSERAKATLVQIGPAVFQGGFSTFLAFVLLADSNSYGFALFFRVCNPVDICLIVRKPDFVVCKQRCRPACTFVQSVFCLMESIMVPLATHKIFNILASL